MTNVNAQETKTHEARFYEPVSDTLIGCGLCPQECRIGPGRTGLCKVRINRDQRLIAMNFGRVSSLAIDPIEKKPLYHYFPGSVILSAGTIGCNLACEFCQNWEISKGDGAPTRLITPLELAEMAKDAAEQADSIGVAYTYSEPGVWFEFLLETMPLVHEQGLKNVLVTNGFLNPGPWRELLKWTDAANIDLKGFTEEYYRKLCHGRLEPVLENIKSAAGRIHLELTTLIIPGENDTPDQLRELAKWIGSIDPEIPLHLSRYFPNYKLSTPATPLETLFRAREIAREYLNYVYLGNVPDGSDTCCPECGNLLIERNGYRTRVLTGERCAGCGRETGIVFH